MSDPFADLPKHHFGAILADPPWRYINLWNIPGGGCRHDPAPYDTMDLDAIKTLPVGSVAAPDAILLLWSVWALLPDCLEVCSAWGFEYKTCGFAWLKADVSQIDIFGEEPSVSIGLGSWTRANSEVCLLATRGKPKRLNADVRQGIIAPRREHSRKPDGIHERIERLVAGPYLELFARQQRKGWTVWGNETDKFPSATGPLFAEART